MGAGDADAFGVPLGVMGGLDGEPGRGGGRGDQPECTSGSERLRISADVSPGRGLISGSAQILAKIREPACGAKGNRTLDLVIANDALWCGLVSAAVMAVLIGWNTLKCANQGSRQA